MNKVANKPIPPIRLVKALIRKAITIRSAIRVIHPPNSSPT